MLSNAQGLTRAKAERLACTLYATVEPAVVELLLLADNEQAGHTLRYAADQALELFRGMAKGDRPVVVPQADAWFWAYAEPEPVKLLKAALMSGVMAVRIKAGNDLAALLAPATIGGR